ncbi:MAG: LOG family protein, partial [Legionellales bacterium]|nr:LOG family protein [Legionellales bacterium]
EYWQDLIMWFKNQMLKKNMISKDDLDLFHIVDNCDEAVKLVKGAI